MRTIRFEYDPNKAIFNLAKHGVSFDEAVTVFEDEFAVLFDDPDHSIDERRMIILGFSANARLLIVCHCEKEEKGVIRIISARKATHTEALQYSMINKGW